ncbi:dual-action HEIGH metallo-peptidase [Aquimarina sp. MAR_2010_214]|uniref:M57 family metalloprotease n=1 Tax=Aquimarina sp. MAR_2010_214 TaxID=1250026 RepID=UPI000C711D70|nr:M57 family metalloprotease [Aquimarina sp. MAR_2010_214]PKV52604.1 dual-action HEIGH metallo-peptidase [Aquimarina sp. MAR_2010_214]
MKKIKVLALCAIVAGFTTSCEKKEVSNEIQPEAVTKQISKAHIQALHDAGVNDFGATYGTVTHPDGSSEEVIKSGDLSLVIENLAEQRLAEIESGSKQYRTNNLVSSSNRNIRIIGYTGSGYALTSKMRTGLQWAVNNYNALNNTLNFTLSFSASTNADMVVYNNGNSGAGGSAGFPSSGRPYKWVQINAGSNSLSNNAMEHLMGHEMGHCLGFRHTDYAKRRCDNSNEGSGGIGAIHIPGTPTANQWGQSGLDTDSIMISCFDGSEDGEFSSRDRTALNYLY